MKKTKYNKGIVYFWHEVLLLTNLFYNLLFPFAAFYS